MTKEYNTKTIKEEFGEICSNCKNKTDENFSIDSSIDHFLDNRTLDELEEIAEEANTLINNIISDCSILESLKVKLIKEVLLLIGDTNTKITNTLKKDQLN